MFLLVSELVLIFICQHSNIVFKEYETTKKGKRKMECSAYLNRYMNGNMRE